MPVISESGEFWRDPESCRSMGPEENPALQTQNLMYNRFVCKAIYEIDPVGKDKAMTPEQETLALQQSIAAYIRYVNTEPHPSISKEGPKPEEADLGSQKIYRLSFF